jgi:hypothetical protein
MYDTRISEMDDDKQFQEFVNAYPESRRLRTVQAHRAFVHALQWTPFETLVRALEQQKRSAQWQKHIIPSMLTWLQQERWTQVLPEPEIPLSRLTPFERARRAGLK